MVDFNRKKKYKKYIYSPFTLFILFLFFLLLLKAVFGVYAKERLSASNLDREQAELNRVLSRKQELAQSIEYLKTETGLEAEIRSKFRVVKEGESVAVILGNEDVGTSTSSTTKSSSFHRWFGFLGF